MSQRSKELDDLLKRLESDASDVKKSESTRNNNHIQGINVNIGGKATVSVGEININTTQHSETPTTNCIACGHIVAKAAKSCPHCGHPVKTSRFKHFLIAMILVPLVTGPPPLFGLFH